MKTATAIRRICHFRLLLALCLALLATGLYEINILQRWDNLAYDIELSILSRSANPDIVIIAIDERSLEQLGRWPWSRSIHADLIDKLTAVDVRAIGLDILFMEADLNKPNADQVLINAINRSGRVVLPVLHGKTGIENKYQFSPPIETLAAAAAELGHVKVETDNEGIVRGLFLSLQTGTTYLPSLALAMQNIANKQLQRQTHVDRKQPAQNPLNFSQHNYHALVPFAGPVGHFNKLSYLDVLNSETSRNQLRDKFILVGMTAAGLGQRFATPVSKDSLLMTGVEFNANTLDALLSGKLIHPLDHFSAAMLTFMLVFTPVFLYGLHSPRQVLLTVLIFTLLTFLISIGLLKWFHLWFRSAPVFLMLILSYPLWSWRRLESVAHSLFEEKEKANATLGAIGDAVVATDAKGIVEFMNPAAEKMLGYTLQQARGKHVGKAFTLDQKILASGVPEIPPVLEGDKTTAEKNCHFLTNRFGQEFAVRYAANPICEESGKMSGMVFAFSDLSKVFEVNQQMAYLATHDPLTQLPNRILLLDRLTQAINIADRFQTRLALLFIDLDGFKKINDGLGHAGGDQLLQEVATRLQVGIRQIDTTARWGGDEFVILLKNLTQESSVAEITIKITHNLSQPFHISGQELFVTPSIGISLFPKDGMTSNQLLTRADAAMHKVKRNGRNNFCFYSKGMNARAHERLIMEKEINYALKDGDFEIYYQPQIDLNSNRLVATEALIRWPHETRGIIAPDEFIPLAEEVGLIIPLGEWIIQKVCRQLRTWHDEGLPEIIVAVNLSPRQFLQKDLVNIITCALSENQIDPTRLQVEITETVMIQDIDRIADVLHDLKSAGISVAIDDFGTGYSSMNFLKRFPIDKLKIDKSFVENVFTSPDDASIVHAIISLGHNLHMKIVAEGVETKAQLNFLKKWHCDIGQGYYFNHPLQVTELTELLRENKPSKSIANKNHQENEGC